MARGWLIAVVLAGCAAPSASPPVDGGSSSDGNAGDAGSNDNRGVYLLDEKFNAMAGGSAPTSPWLTSATTGASAIVREVPFAADHSVELMKPTGAGAAKLETTFAAQSGRIAFEAKVLARETAGFKAIPYVYDGERVIASVSFHDGNIEARVGETITIMQAFSANVWYRVRVVVDTDHDTFDLLVDGVRKAHDQPLRATTDAVSKLAYYVDSAPAGTLVVDNVKVYNEASFIGAAPKPVFDARDFGAAGDGTTNDQLAIQRAIDAAAGTGGSVVLANGTFLSGTLTLASKMTFFIAPSATLLGSASAADYPLQSPASGNTQLGNCRRALLYAAQASELVIDGGGTLDGQGDGFGGAEAMRPMLIWSVLSDHVTVRNLYLKKGAMWSLVTMESDHVLIDNVNVQSDFITHDGIDIVDGYDVTISNSAVRSGDDAMCLKTGVRRGIDTLIVRDSIFSGSNGGSNGIKFGTGSYGAFKHISIEDSYVKDVQYAAMAVESRQGADVDDVSFHRIEFANTGSAFFLYLAQQAVTHPVGDVPKLGSMTNVTFTDIAGSTASWGNSPHQGSLITGHTFDNVTYAIKNLAFTNVAVGFTGGRTSTPAPPPEAMPNQYPESNMFGDLPAWGYYLRHVDGISFTGCRSTAAAADVRQKIVSEDVANLSGAP
ncbi:MAG TPA: glycosyl hydrolase family 28 protein [Kofleriaceae bacterium]